MACCRSLSWVSVEISSRRSFGFIWENAFLYRLMVSRETSSSSAVCVWFWCVMASMYLAVVSRVSPYSSSMVCVSILVLWLVVGYLIYLIGGLRSPV